MTFSGNAKRGGSEVRPRIALRAFAGCPALLALVLLPSPAIAAPVFIDFESFSDLDPVGAIGVASFTNAVVLTSGAIGGSLNEFDFPPNSLFNVGSDSGGPIRIGFSTPVVSFRAFFTYNAPLTLEAFDAGSNSLGSVASAFSANIASGGGSPNEVLTIAAAGIRSVEIAGDPGGASFAMDDITFETVAGPVPEPATLLLLGVAAVAAARRRVIGSRVSQRS